MYDCPYAVNANMAVGSFLTGAAATGIVAGAINAKKVHNEELSKDEAVSKTLRTGAQGGAAFATVAVASRLIGCRSSLLAIGAVLAAGAGTIYMLESEKKEKAAEAGTIKK